MKISVCGKGGSGKSTIVSKVLEQAIGDPERILAVLPIEPELTKAALRGQKLILENSELDQAAKKICRTQI